MRTDDLVNMLATGSAVVTPNAVARRYTAALGMSALGALLLMGLLLGVRHDLGAAIFLPMFWVKLAFVACLAVASWLATLRLSRPGQQLGRVIGALVAPTLAMWVLAVFVLVQANPAQRAPLFFGDTWTVCPLLIALLSAPGFVAVLWAMKGLAPTRLRLAGATAGLSAGAIGALVYCLHCPELGAPFIGVWYLFGILIPTGLGALIGPRLLRW